MFVGDNNTMMIPYTYQSLIGDIFKSDKTRHIICDLQLFEALFNHGCNEALFHESLNRVALHTWIHVFI
jgi:hypothetical protein